MNNPLGPCPLCCGATSKVTTKHTIHVDGVPYTSALAAWRCSKCSEEYFHADDLSAFEKQIAKALLKARSDGPEAFRRLRSTAMQESQVFAASIGTTPETVSRWENGRMPINGAAFEVVRLLAAKALGIDYTTPMVRQTVRVRLEPARKAGKAKPEAPRAAASAKPKAKRSVTKAPAR